METYSIYVTNRKKDGTVTKSDSFINTADNLDTAIEMVTRTAKLYGFRGKVHIGSIFKRNHSQKKWEKV
jgi:hypothetical protein